MVAQQCDQVIYACEEYRNFQDSKSIFTIKDFKMFANAFETVFEFAYAKKKKKKKKVQLCTKYQALFWNSLDIILSTFGACNWGTQIKNLYTSVSIKSTSSLEIKSRNIHFKALKTLNCYDFQDFISITHLNPTRGLRASCAPELHW